MQPSPQQLGMSSRSPSSPPARSHALQHLSRLPSAAMPHRAMSGSPVSLASFYASCSGTAMYSDYSQDASSSIRQGSQSSSSSDSRTLTFRRTAARTRPGPVLEDSPFGSTSPVMTHSTNNWLLAEHRETAAKRLNFSDPVTPCLAHSATHADPCAAAGETQSAAAHHQPAHHQPAHHQPAHHQPGCQAGSGFSALLPVVQSSWVSRCDDTCHQGIPDGRPQPASESAAVTFFPHRNVADTQTSSISQNAALESVAGYGLLHQSKSHSSQQRADGPRGHSREEQSPSAPQLGAECTNSSPAHADCEAKVPVITISSSCDDDTSPLLAWTATRTPRRRVAIATDSDTEDEGQSECPHLVPVAAIDSAHRDSEAAARHVTHNVTSTRTSSSSCTPGQDIEQLENPSASDQLDTANGSAQTRGSSLGPTPPWMSCYRPGQPAAAADSSSAVSASVDDSFGGGRVSTKPVQRVLFSDGPGVDYYSCAFLR